MNTQGNRFLRWWSITYLVLMLAVVAFNYAIDPYRVFQAPTWSRFNANKSAIINQTWLYKAYEINRQEPVTLLLGSSRVAAGMDALSPSWPSDFRPVYNLGIDAGTPYVALRYLQHAMSTNVPKTVVIGLDFELFLDVLEASHSVHKEFESRLATNPDGTANRGAPRQRLSDIASVLLSYDALSDTIGTVTQNVLGKATAISAGNEIDSELDTIIGQTGTRPWFEWMNLINVRRLTSSFNSFAMSDLRSLLALCASQNIRVILYIHPIPAQGLEMLDLLGCWNAFEDWKRELVDVVSEYAQPGASSRVLLWDFSDYDDYSMEVVEGGGHVMRWFIEAWHYKPALGDLIIQRISGVSDFKFGSRLVPEGLETHLAEIRQRRQIYRETHPTEVAHVQSLYDAGVRALRLRQEFVGGQTNNRADGGVSTAAIARSNGQPGT